MSANKPLMLRDNVPAPRLRPGVGQGWGFVALAYALTWGLWIPVLLANPDAGPWALVLGGFGPAVAAAVGVRLQGGTVWSWLRSIVIFRLPVRRYAMAVGTPLGAGVAVGVVWAGWHAPLFWLYPAYEGVVAAFYVPTIVALSVIIAFLWNRSRQSVIIAIAIHASFNASNELFIVGEQATAPDVQFVAQAVLAIVTVGVAVALAIRHGRQLGRPVDDTTVLKQS